jgi:hypothetical protein
MKDDRDFAPLYPVKDINGNMVKVVNILRVIDFLLLIDGVESADEIISALPENIIRFIALACRMRAVEPQEDQDCSRGY